MRLPDTERPVPLLRWPVRRPVLTLGITLALAIIAAVGASRIRPSASLRAMAGDSSPSAVALERILDDFRDVDDLFILVTAADEPATEPERAAAPLLAFARSLEAAIRADPATSPLCTRIIAGGDDAQAMEFVRAEVVPAGLWYLDDQALEQIIRRLTLSEMRDQLRRDEVMIATPGPAAAAITKALLQDPLRLREFVAGQIGAPAGPSFLAPDGRALLVRISGARPASDLDFCALITSRVGAIAQRVRPPGVNVELAGAYAIAARAASSIRRDMISNSVWSVVLMQALFLLSYRRLGAFSLAFLPIGLAILFAFGSFSIYKTRITPLTAVGGAVLAGLGIDYCIHYLSHYQAAMDSPGSDPRSAADRTIRQIGMPLLAAGLTTVHGFAAVAFAGVAALRDFALLGALGLAWSMIAAVTILPAVLGLPVGRRVSVGGARFDAGPLIRAITRRAGVWILIGAAGLAGMLLAATVRSDHALELDTDLTVMHPRPSAPLEAQREISRRFSGLADSLLLLIEGDSPDNLAVRAHAAQRVLSGPEGRAIGYAGSFGLASLVPDPARTADRLERLRVLDPDRIVADFEAAVRDSPFSPEAFRPYAEFLRTLVSQRQPPTVLALARYPALTGSVLRMPDQSVDRGPARTLTILFFDRNLDDRVQRDGVIAGARSLLSAVPGATLTGIGVVGSDLETIIRHALPRVLAISAAAVVLTILVAFRRPTDVLLVLLPATWGLGAVLAWMAFAQERLNMANMIAFPILLGICIDYGIFMVGLARACRLAGLGTAPLVERLSASGHAVLMTSGTTIIGFGTLLTSSTPAIQSLGRLVGIGVAGCVVGTFFLLVPLLYVLHRPLTGAGSGR